jgi:hypothetical protein
MVKMTSVWEATTDFLREHAGAVLPIAGGLVFVPSVLSNLVETGTAANAVGPAMLGGGLAAVVLMIVSLWGGAAITALAITPSRPGSAIARAGQRLPALIGITLLLLVAVVVLTLPIFGILVAGGVQLAAFLGPATTLPALAGGTALALFAYGFALIAAFLWISARLAVLLPVILAERRGVGAIRHAWTLTRGHGWRLVGVYLLYGLVALVLSGAVGAVAGLIGVLLSGATTGITVGAVVVAVAAALVAVILAVVQSAFVGRLYAALSPTEELRETFA